MTLTCTCGSSSISPSATVSDQTSGAAVFAVTDSAPETITYSALVNGVPVQNTAAIDFVTPRAATGSIVANPTTVGLNGTSTVTVTLLNGQNPPGPVAGKTVTLSQGGGHSTVDSATGGGVTDQNGQVGFTVSDVVNEQVTYTASDATDGLPVPGSATVTFTSNPPSSCFGGTPAAKNGYAFSNFATGFLNGSCIGPIGVAFDPQGSLLVGDIQNSTVYRFGAGGGVAGPGTTVGQVPTATGGPVAGLAFGPDGELYAAQSGNIFFEGLGGQVVQLEPATAAIKRVVAAVPGLGTTDCATGLAVDPLSHDLFESQPSCAFLGGERQIDRISGPATNSPSIAPYETQAGADGLAFGPDGTLYAASGGSVLAISGTNKAQPPTVTTVTSFGPGQTPDGIAVGLNPANPSGPPLLFVNRNDGTITKVDLSQNPATQTDIFSGGTRGDFVTVGPDGCLYATQTDTVLKITKSDGTCAFAPIGTQPSISLAPSSISPNPGTGTPETFTASLHNVASPAGTQVSFTVTGANPQTKQVTADASGQAAFTYLGVHTGADTIVATAAPGGVTVTSNAASVTWVAGAHVTFTDLNTSPTGGPQGVATTLVAHLTDETASTPSAPVMVAGQPVTLGIAAQTCTGTTDSSGTAHCALTPTETPGLYPLTATYAGSTTGNPTYTASSARASFTVTAPNPAPSSVGLTLSATTVTTGTAVHGSATLTGFGSGAGGNLTYTVYAGTACSGTPVFTSTVAVSNQTAPNSADFTPTTAGTYTWQAVYTPGPGLLPSSSPCGSATVTVTGGAGGGRCAVCVLDPSRPGALTLRSSATLSVAGGAVAVDSSSPSAVVVGAGASLSAQAIDVTGGVVKDAGATLTPAPTTGAAVVADPFAGLVVPSSSGPSQGSVTLSSGSRTLAPGVYAGISVTGSATLSLSPGLYVLTGPLSLSSRAGLSGTGVTLYLTCPGYSAATPAPCNGQAGGGLSVSAGASMRLSAPATGPQAGVVLFADRGNVATLTLSSGSSLSLSGAVYAATGTLSVNSGTGTSQVGAPIVVGSLTLNSSAQLVLSAATTEVPDGELLAEGGGGGGEPRQEGAGLPAQPAVQRPRPSAW